MKVLLIDNYDSFTFNVYQYLKEITDDIEFYRNNQITLNEIRTLNPELIVLSPGPKTPQDAGICIDIIQEFKKEIPIFGICLGHQAINEAFGGKTTHARELVHGKKSKILSLHQGIMKHFDSFYATRYHSLAVSEEELPECLEVTCKTIDGEIMGLKHRDYPIEGVQFHPESILTEQGKEMLHLFIKTIPQKSGYSHKKRTVKQPIINHCSKTKQPTINIEQVIHEYSLKNSFEDFFQSIYAHYPSEEIFLMDSAAGPNVDKENSLVGLFPQFDFTVKQDKMRVITQDKNIKKQFINQFQEFYHTEKDYFILPKGIRFSEIFKKIKIIFSIPSNSSSKKQYYSNGLVGFFSYEYLHHLEQIPRQNHAPYDVPDIHLTYYSTLIDYAINTGTIKVIGNFINEVAQEKYEQFLVHLPIFTNNQFPKKQLTNLENDSLEPFDVFVQKEKYLKDIKRAKNYIKNGDIFQVQLGTRFAIKADLSPLKLFNMIRTISPSPYMFLWERANISLIGNSPEMQLKIKDRLIVSRPIAGTSKGKGKNQEERQKVISDLVHSEKEQAEHVMLVDLARNDISKVSETGSVKVDKLMAVEEYHNVFHMTSTVTGKLIDTADSLTIFEDSFPAGTLSGAPKIRAMEIIQELEQDERGPYGGSFGFFDFSGDINSAIIIRTIMKIDQTLIFQASAGIVADSITEEEWNEIFYKTATLRKIIHSLNNQTK